jgi:hypothetical protein
MSRPRLKKPIPIHQVLDETLRGLGLAVEIERYRVWGLWDEVVGTHISEHAQPTRIRRECLFVTVEDSMWLHQLNMMKHQILAELNRRLGKAGLKEIILRVGEVSMPRSSAPNGHPSLSGPPPLDRPNLLDIEEILAPIKERDCEAVLGRILQIHFSSPGPRKKATIH